jgi:Asp-tRNA(Asn)/Glu-tRNA(Gln) amidotransferase A subunit family amidase
VSIEERAELAGVAERRNDRLGVGGIIHYGLFAAAGGRFADSGRRSSRDNYGATVDELTTQNLRAALAVVGLEFGDDELEMMLERVAGNREFYTSLRTRHVDECTPPAVTFDPSRLVEPFEPPAMPSRAAPVPAATASEQLEWAGIARLSERIRSREVSCVELAELMCARLAKLDPTLHCVVTPLEEQALERARALDRELDSGHWRGPLHGIPWGAKDILAVRGAPTTWGSGPYEEQRFDYDAAVVERLHEAGAVCVAKLSTGQLAMGDVWFGGMTRSPWDPSRGSSGSSAGPASATAAGAVTFSIGTETIGSIVSPSSVCGCSSLRPTFGRVSRYGAMALSWSFDKIGPMCRSVDDAAIVFEAIAGRDARDPSTVEAAFTPPARVDVRGWRVGYFDAEGNELPAGTLDELRALGVELVPWTPPKVSQRAVMIASMPEQGCAFDDLTRSPDLARVVTQTKGGWPDTFRTSRLVPAVEYLRVQRERTGVVVAMEESLRGLVGVVHASPVVGSATGHSMVVLSNFTGHPAVIAPGPLRDDGTPASVTFTGHLLGEEPLLALASAWQHSTGHHHHHPAL